MSGTPCRVAKIYFKEVFHGLNPKNKPRISTFENKYGHGKMLTEQKISIDSSCEHHFCQLQDSLMSRSFRIIVWLVFLKLIV